MTIFVHNLKRIFFNKARFTMLLIIPIMFILIFAFNNFNTITIGIVDEDQSALSQKVIEELKQNEFYNVKMINKNELSARVSSYEVDYAFMIEEGFEDELITNQKVKVKEYYFIENENIRNAQMYLQNYLSHLLTISKSSQNNQTKFNEILTDYESSQLEVINQDDKTSDIQQTIAVVGLTLYLLVFLSVVTCGIILEDRQNGTLARIFNSPITLKNYFVQSLLSFVTVSFIQLTILMFVFKVLFNFYFNDHVLSIFIILFTFSLVSITMGLMIISFVKSPLHAYIIVGLIASPICMLGGSFWPIEMMPDVLQKVGQFLPTYWVMDAANEIMADGNVMDISNNVLVLLLFAAVFFFAGMFNKKEFAYEK